MEKQKEYMKRAINLSIENVKNGGGPFGAVIVKDGKIISEGVNRVSTNCDPTAHAEITAIRQACQQMKNFTLKGCTIYTSCEPCPMCLSAIYWAGIEKIYYANTKKDAEAIGFSDNFIYEEFALPKNKRSIKSEQMMHTEAMQAFRDWENKEDKIVY